MLNESQKEIPAEYILNELNFCITLRDFEDTLKYILVPMCLCILTTTKLNLKQTLECFCYICFLHEYISQKEIVCLQRNLLYLEARLIVKTSSIFFTLKIAVCFKRTVLKINFQNSTTNTKKIVLY